MIVTMSAIAAVTAAYGQIDRNAVTPHDGCYARADFLNDTGRLMSGDEIASAVSLYDRLSIIKTEIAPADGGSLDPNHHFTVGGCWIRKSGNDYLPITRQ